MICDLVKRLRAEELPKDTQHQYEARITLWAERQEAADRIEELEAVLLLIANTDPAGDQHWSGRVARAALRGKKDD
jgi:hypothetical protein